MELEESLNSRQEKLLETSKFLAKLLAAGIVFRIAILVFPDTSGLQSMFAGFTAGALEMAGIQARSEGVYVIAGATAYEITRDCLGWKSMAAFLGLVFATPEREKLRFAALGLLVIVAANVVRVMTTLLLDLWGVLSFSIIHGTLWKWGLTAVVLGLWIIWYRGSLIRRVEKLRL